MRTTTGTSTTDTVPPGKSTGGRRRAPDRWWAIGAVAATLVITICAARAVQAGVQLVDERALFEVRARDVFTEHSPLLGLRSSAGTTADGFNHLGPVLFWWLSPFVHVLGAPVGVTIGIAALNIGSVWLAVVAARVAGGARLALATGLAVTALCWTLGSELVIDPWQPNALVLPFFGLLAATTAVASGRSWWLTATVALATLCTQTHLGYLLLGPALVLTAIGAIVWRSVQTSRIPPGRALVASAVILAVLWSPVLWQQVAGPGRGNLVAVLDGASVSDRVGVCIALRLWSAVTTVPPWWFPPSYGEPPQALLRVEGDTIALDPGQLPSLWLASVSVCVAVAIAVLIVLTARQRGIDGSRAAILVTIIGTVVAVVSIALLPVDVFGVVAHKYRDLWPLAAFGAAVFVGHVNAVLEQIGGRRALRWTVGAATAATVLVSVVAIKTRPLDHGGVSNRELWPVLDQLRSQLADYRPPGVVEVETDGLPFPDHYSHTVLAQLSESGVPFQVTTETMVDQLGPSRRADGSAATRLVIRQAPNDTAAPEHGQQIARVDVAGVPAVAVYEVTE